MPVLLNFDIGPGLNPFERHFFLVRNVPTNIKPLKQQFNIDESQTLILRPASAILSSLLNDIDFNFVQEVVISVYDDDPDDATDLFFTNQVPVNAGTHVLVVPIDSDVYDLLNKDRVNYRISMLFRSITPTSIEANLDLNFTAE